MDKNKVAIDLSKMKLSDEQLKKVNTAIQKSVSTQLANISKSKKNIDENIVPEVAGKTATLTIKITNTNPGDSSVSAILNGAKKTVDRTGSISFDNVAKGNLISIQSYSLGSVEIDIDIDADPETMSFTPGHHNNLFLIN